MMKKFSVRFLATLISILLAGLSVILGCAGGWWTISESTNFTPEIFVDSVYRPFFFNNETYYYEDYDDKHNYRFNHKVVSDWSLYFDKKISDADLQQMLFSTREKSIDSVIKGNIPAFLKTNKLSNLKDKKVNSFLNYLLLAKQAESFALRGPDDWSYYDRPAVKRSSPADFCKKVASEFERSKDKFIRQRLWFQLIRAYFFNDDHQACINAFEKSAAEFSNSSIYYRSLCYAAGALKKSGNISKANYYFSVVYENEPLLKTVAHYSFKPQDEKDWKQTLQFAKSVNEKCVLWQMVGVYYNDEIRSLKEILALDPKSDKVDLLLTRTVNSVESAMFSPGSADLDSTYARNQTQKSSQLRALCKTVLEKNEVVKPYMWHMSLAYLETLSGNYPAAGKQLSHAKTSVKDKLVLSQVRILQLINTLFSLKTIDKHTEDVLLPEFKWLRETVQDPAQKVLRTNAVSHWLQRVMAKKYREQGDSLKAEFFDKTDKFYTNDDNLHEMQRFCRRTDKTAYEQYCMEVYRLSLDDLYEYEAILKTFQDKIDEAIALMEKTGSRASVELLSNPFNGGIKDCHDCDHAKPQKIKYTKLSTMKKMKEMKNDLSKDTYNNALLLANAFYNMTYYGSSRVFYGNNVVEWDHTNMDMADKYYKMALESAVTPEQKAKCIYMLAKCERNSIINESVRLDEIVVAEKYFAELKKLSDTKYAKEVITECSWFKSYTLVRK